MFGAGSADARRRFGRCLAQVRPMLGAGTCSSWRRCDFGVGTCAAKRAYTQSSGAGVAPFSTPAPPTPDTCSTRPRHLLHPTQTPAPPDPRHLLHPTLDTCSTRPRHLRHQAWGSWTGIWWGGSLGRNKAVRGPAGRFFGVFWLFGKNIAIFAVEKGGDRDSVVGCFLIARMRARGNTETKETKRYTLWQLST